MKYMKAFFVVIVIASIELVIIGFLMKKDIDAKSTTNILFYDEERKSYTVWDENGEDLIWVSLNDDNTLLQCTIFGKNNIKIGVIFDENNRRTLFIQDPTIYLNYVQYINLSDEILVDRQETIGYFLRHSQIFKDGTIQQRKWNYDKSEWELELPSNGEWRNLYPFFGDTTRSVN